MNKDKLIIVGVVVALAIGVFVLRGKIGSFGSPNLSQLPSITLATSSPAPVSGSNPKASGSPVNSLPGSEYVVVYTDAGYSPSTLTIKKGDTVIWKNQSSRSVWTASAIHPTHEVYDGTSLADHCPNTDGTAFDECKKEAPGTTWSFKFEKAGTWGYHNHSDSRHFGKIIVESGL